MYGEHQGHRVGMRPRVTLETLFLTSRICRLPLGDEPRAGYAYWAAILLHVLLEEPSEHYRSYGRTDSEHMEGDIGRISSPLLRWPGRFTGMA